MEHQCSSTICTSVWS